MSCLILRDAALALWGPEDLLGTEVELVRLVAFDETTKRMIDVALTFES